MLRHHQQQVCAQGHREGADGLIAVATGAGGHAGSSSPFALVRRFASGSMVRWPCRAPLRRATPSWPPRPAGPTLLISARRFIATTEARASEAYKQAIVDCNSDDIVYSNLFTGVHGNYLAPSIRNAGLDPEHLPESDPSKMNFGGNAGAKAWKDIWGCGQVLAPSTRSKRGRVHRPA